MSDIYFCADCAHCVGEKTNNASSQERFLVNGVWDFARYCKKAESRTEIKTGCGAERMYGECGESAKFYEEY